MLLLSVRPDKLCLRVDTTDAESLVGELVRCSIRTLRYVKFFSRSKPSVSIRREGKAAGGKNFKKKKKKKKNA